MARVADHLKNEPDELAAYWMPFTANRAFRRRPRLMTSAKGMYYQTSDGRSVIDATSGLFCVNAGHGREEITAAIQESAARLDYAPAFQFAHPQAFELANRLVGLAPPGLDHVFFANSGSEAVDTAMKIALAYHRARDEGQRTRFIGRERGYHGVGFGGLSVGGIPANRRDFGVLLPGVDHLRSTYDRGHQSFSVGEPEWGRELADELEQLLLLHGASNIAGVVIEPVAGSTGCLPPPKGYLERIRDITKRHGVLLILDEVITGFGRLGYAFGAERYGLTPDIITFAKGVTNGAVPLAGALVSSEIHEALMIGPVHVPELFHGYTNSGHPLATAAALATLDIYRDEKLFERAGALEEQFAEIMMELKSSPIVLDIRPIGLMCGIDIEASPEGPGVRGYELMEHSFHNHDLYVRVTGDTMVVAPPLIATIEDIADIRDRAASALEAVA